MDWRFWRKENRAKPWAVLEALLVLALLVQGARLFWAAVTPPGPVGKWYGARPVSAVAGSGGFDPFFRMSAASGPAQANVTSLALKLFGVRMDGATGRGSAIIQTPDGVQSSFAVGEDIVPGVKLKQVALDNVTLDRGGVAEQLFLDQSVPPPAAPAVATAAPATTPSAPLPTVTASAASLMDSVQATPRSAGGGLILSPKGDGAQFRAVGLEPGDVLVSVNGRPIQGIGELTAIQPGAQGVALQVERAGRSVTINAKTGQ